MTKKKAPSLITNNASDSPLESSEEAAKLDLNPEEISEHWLNIVGNNDDQKLQKAVAKEINSILKKYSLDHYQVLFLFDSTSSIESSDSNRLYEAASQNKKTKDVLLIIHSTGGSIEPAYLISKSLKYFAKEKFVVAIPRKAKSAATLICLGADEIHMGMTSQLGPIDPQIGGLPALGLANALDTLASLASRFPDASKMLSSYLEAKLDLRVLGYFNRVSESAVQYGERLLAGKSLPQSSNYIADHLVNHYKDHAFVIDIDEALSLLGDKIVKVETQEYKAASDIFSLLDLFEFVLKKRENKRFWLTGTAEEGLSIVPIRKN